MKKLGMIFLCAMLCVASACKRFGAPRAEASLESALSKNTAEIKFPIINFHHVGPIATNATEKQVTYTTTPEVLEAELKYLKDHGYRTVLLDVLIDAFDKGVPLPPKAVALTFDDGWRDQFRNAFPLLKKYGMVGSFFIPVGWVGHSKVMGWTELRELADAGMGVGTHGYLHWHFDTIHGWALDREIVQTKKTMEQHLGRPVDVIAYPGGYYNAEAIGVVKAAGYKLALTTKHRIGQSAALRFEVGRFHGGNSLETVTDPLTSNSY